MARKIDLGIIHCSATPPSMDIGAEKITEWHLANGWSDIGYHFVIKRNGVIETGRSLEKVGAHAKGYNKNSVGICYVGGVNMKGKPENNMTEEQEESLKTLISFLIFEHNIVKFIGHNEVSRKACPSFDVQEWLKANNINI